MHYENFLFTRNQRQDFTAFVRPSQLSNRDVSTIGGIFNYVSDISRLTASFPSLYCFPLGEYVLLLRHYNSERQHAGRAIGVIEGIAIRQAEIGLSGGVVAQMVSQQAELLNVSAAVADIEAQGTETSAEFDWNGGGLRRDVESFVGEFLEQRDENRLFVPFTPEGRELLISTLADTRFSTPPFFAFGTNSDVLAQLERLAAVDLVSFFKTDRASFRSRRTNRVSSFIGEEQAEDHADSSMSLRPASADEMQIRPQRKPRGEDDSEAYEDTHVDLQTMSVRGGQKTRTERQPETFDDEDDDGEATVLTMRQIRDRARAEEATAMPAAPEAKPPANPLQWLARLVSSIFSPRKSD